LDKKLQFTISDDSVFGRATAIDRNAKYDIVFAMKIFVLALSNVFDTGLATVLDAFQTANELAEMSGMSAPRFDAKIVGMKARVMTAQGLAVPVTRPGGGAPDCVIVPAIGYKMPEPLERALAKKEVQDAAATLRVWAKRGALMSAACVGTFVMAESGLLDGQHSTTTWWLAPVFRKRYPQVIVEESHMIVKSGRVVTAGAALSHMDLALWLIRQKSPKLAALTAKYLIVDSRPAQSAYVISDHLIHSDPMVERFENWARIRLPHGFSLDEAAKSVATSKRTLARRLQTVLGKTPLEYFQSLRVERAVHLLKTTNESVDEIASRVGYEDGVTLRTLLRRKLGRGIKEIRRAA